MQKLLILAALGAAFPALADEGDKLRAKLIGINEVPSVSTVARGEFEARISRDEGMIEYELSYSDLQGTVTQSHIHVGQRHTTGGITIWLCQTTGTPAPAAVAGLTPMCPPSGTVTGTITAANVIGPVGAQQVPVGGLAQVIDAIRAGATYANVHSNLSPGGEIRGQISASNRGGRHD